MLIHRESDCTRACVQQNEITGDIESVEKGKLKQSDVKERFIKRPFPKLRLKTDKGTLLHEIFATLLFREFRDFFLNREV